MFPSASLFSNRVATVHLAPSAGLHNTEVERQVKAARNTIIDADKIQVALLDTSPVLDQLYRGQVRRVLDERDRRHPQSCRYATSTVGFSLVVIGLAMAGALLFVVSALLWRRYEIAKYRRELGNGKGSAVAIAASF
ncbi:hypothetical protein ml_442 [Mollivirus sibericum]|uniref:hypothetical protein n=1 Tax=Mollivirus sibericum TaxID=1678078 RepID=UPI0006B2EB7F|nr:hypothetical protein ml_442 [Mollivirus sibericum]ALD62244.1 hypothetical protein ml_442 [Mollivirus sibericum]QHN71402.1 hypothetical protein [Mollivirus kamchatka]